MTTKTVSTILAITALIFGISWYIKTYKMTPALPSYEQALFNSQGVPVKVSDLKGKFVLISYFQTWCADCIREIPSMEKLQQSVRSQKLVILLVSDESQNKLLRFKENHAGSLDVYSSALTLKEQGIHVFPTSYLLNENGQVIMSQLQGFDWNSVEVRNLIK
ncbi:MAG: TlpA family protein disulfide reductase [Bacteroidota bacterium]|nr:TlpA family protein disulfide reductase [Bacteroidota bacterium]